MEYAFLKKKKKAGSSFEIKRYTCVVCSEVVYCLSERASIGVLGFWNCDCVIYECLVCELVLRVCFRCNQI